MARATGVPSSSPTIGIPPSKVTNSAVSRQRWRRVGPAAPSAAATAKDSSDSGARKASSRSTVMPRRYRPPVGIGRLAVDRADGAALTPLDHHCRVCHAYRLPCPGHPVHREVRVVTELGGYPGHTTVRTEPHDRLGDHPVYGLGRGRVRRLEV